MDDLLQDVEASFAGIARPEHFTDHEHCSECADYDALFLAKSPSTLEPSDFGRSGLWDPVNFLTEQGFLYFLPALARFACARGDGYCLDQFVFQLTEDRIAAMSASQRASMRAFVISLAEHLSSEPDIEVDRRDVDACIKRLAA